MIIAYRYESVTSVNLLILDENKFQKHDSLLEIIQLTH